MFANAPLDSVYVYCAARRVPDETWISALTRMTPDPLEPVGNGHRGAETRSERLDEERTPYAVISGNGDGRLHVTAPADPQARGTEWRRLRQDILGRQPGARIHRMTATDLIGRTVANQHGAEFHVGGLTLDATTGRIVIELLDLDDDGRPVPGTECGINSLDGWQIF